MERFQQSKHALGSDAVLTVITDRPDTSRIFNNLWILIEEFEGKFSRFRPDSELTAFNQAAGREVHISPPFYDLLKTAKDLSGITMGLYNPFVLPALQQAGYKGSWPAVGQYDERINYSGRHITKAEDIRFRDDTARIPSETALDFGGIGKGYLLDKVADSVEAHGITDYWLSLGGDILCRGNDITGHPWRVGIQSTEHPEIAIAHIETTKERLAIATSGTIKRKGPGWHHIIDPRSAVPAETDVLTATVALNSGIHADVFAKCFVIVGSQGINGLMEKSSIENVLIQTDGAQAAKVIQKGSAWSN